MDFPTSALRQAQRYFDDVLPRFVERHYRGQGQEFLFHLFEAHDRRDLSSIEGVTPRRGALKRADFVRHGCPLQLSERAARTEAGLLLGLFEHSTWEQGMPLGGSYPVSHHRWVTLYAGSFAAAGWEEEQLDEEVFWTIFHEYLHYFESHLLRREQHLALREAGIQSFRPTLAEARRLDRRGRVRRGVLAVAGTAVLAACVAIPVVSAAPRRAELQVMGEMASPRAPSAPSADELSRVDEENRALDEAVDRALRERASPELVASWVASRPVCDTAAPPSLVLGARRSRAWDPCAAARTMAADEEVAGAARIPDEAERSLVWLRPQVGAGTLRLVGLSWLTDGSVIRTDLRR